MEGYFKIAVLITILIGKMMIHTISHQRILGYPIFRPTQRCVVHIFLMVLFIYCRVLDNGQWGRTWNRRKIEGKTPNF